MSENVQRHEGGRARPLAIFYSVKNEVRSCLIVTISLTSNVDDHRCVAFHIYNFFCHKRTTVEQINLTRSFRDVHRGKWTCFIINLQKVKMKLKETVRTRGSLRPRWTGTHATETMEAAEEIWPFGFTLKGFDLPHYTK